MSGRLAYAAAPCADWHRNGRILLHDVTHYPMVAHIVAELDEEDDAPSDDRHARDRAITPALAPMARQTYYQGR